MKRNLHNYFHGQKKSLYPIRHKKQPHYVYLHYYEKKRDKNQSSPSIQQQSTFLHQSKPQGRPDFSNGTENKKQRKRNISKTENKRPEIKRRESATDINTNKIVRTSTEQSDIRSPKEIEIDHLPELRNP